MSEEQSPTPEPPQMTPIEATRRLWEMGLAYVYSQVLFTAIDLGLFDVLSRGAATPDALAQHLHIHPEGCRRLLVALRQLGLVDCDHHLYTNSALGAYLAPMHRTPSMAYPWRAAPFIACASTSLTRCASIA